MIATVAPEDLEIGKSNATRRISFSPWLLSAFLLSLLGAMCLPRRNGLPGYMLILAVSNLAQLFVVAAFDYFKPKLDNLRLHALDVFRGVVMQHITLFHLVWSFKRAGLAQTCNHALHNMPVTDFAIFCIVVVVGHAGLICFGRWHMPAAHVYFIWYSWTLIQTWSSWSQRTGMALMMFAAGYSSKLSFDRAGSFWQFASRHVRHIMLLGLTAAAISAFSVAFAASRGFRRTACRCSAMHLLLAGAICQVPFLFFPYVSLAVGFAGVMEHIRDNRYFQPRNCGGFDTQPFQLGLSAQLLAIGACHLRLFNFTLQKWLAHSFPRISQVWTGQHTLRIYLAHQAVFFPLAFILASVLKPLGWQKGQLWCSYGGMAWANVESAFNGTLAHANLTNFTSVV